MFRIVKMVGLNLWRYKFSLTSVIKYTHTGACLKLIETVGLLIALNHVVSIGIPSLVFYAKNISAKPEHTITSE